MDHLFRRQSGIYFCRLVVPARHRAIIGKTELISSTGVRDLAIAKIVGAELVAQWRRQFLDLESLTNPMNVIQLKIGSPTLLGAGYLPLQQASEASGLDPDELLRHASQNRIRIYFQPGQTEGFMVPYADLDFDDPANHAGLVVPTRSTMPQSAVAIDQPGILTFHPADINVHCLQLLEDGDTEVILFSMVGKQGQGFAPNRPLKVSRSTARVSIPEIERLRGVLATRVTPEQFAAAHTVNATNAPSSKSTRRVSEALDAFMAEREKSCSVDQARRIRAGCHLFVELEGNPRLCDVDRDQLRRFRDHTLPSIPARENKVRLKYATTTVSESIAYLVGKPWPTISTLEATKRMQWLCGLFAWLTDEKWITDDPAVGLDKAKVQRKKGTAANKKREQFTRKELTTIFSVDWYRTGRGKLTSANTYREFLPLYFWLPLLGLFTGARINELCQLSLQDIVKVGHTWVFDLNENDPDELKKLKNANSIRRIPIHPLLIELGLLDWRAALEAQNESRLFPELKHDNVKGYSKGAVKWFSNFLGRFGWPRDGKKVFHSFRHTLASECLNKLGLSEAVTAQISGHSQGASVLMTTYRKDSISDDLVKVITMLDFDLPHIALFDVSEGLKALANASERKQR